MDGIFSYFPRIQINKDGFNKSENKNISIIKEEKKYINRCIS